MPHFCPLFHPLTRHIKQIMILRHHSVKSFLNTHRTTIAIGGNCLSALDPFWCPPKPICLSPSVLALICWFLWPQFIRNTFLVKAFTGLSMGTRPCLGINQLSEPSRWKESVAAIKRSSDGPPTWASVTSSNMGWMHTSGDQHIGWGVQVHPCITPPAGCQLWHIVARDHCICSPNCSQASEIKSPWDPFATAGEPSFSSASHTTHWHFHGCLFFLRTSALTFGEFSQLFPSLCFFFFSLSTFSLLWWLPLSCFVLLFRSFDFYGDCKLPRNNESLGIKKREQWWIFHK